MADESVCKHQCFACRVRVVTRAVSAGAQTHTTPTHARPQQPLPTSSSNHQLTHYAYTPSEPLAPTTTMPTCCTHVGVKAESLRDLFDQLGPKRSLRVDEGSLRLN